MKLDELAYATPHQQQERRFAGLDGSQVARRVLRGVDLVAIHLEQDVAPFQPRACRRREGLDVLDHGAAHARGQPELAGDIGRDVAERKSESGRGFPRAAAAAVLCRLVLLELDERAVGERIASDDVGRIRAVLVAEERDSNLLAPATT